MTKEKKNVLWNMIGASFNAFNSLFFTIIVTRINGLNDAGIFTYSFATACLLYNIGIYEGRAFQVTDIKGKNSDSDYLYNKLFTCIIMMIIAFLFAIIKKYDTYKLVIFMLLNLFRCVEAFAEGVYGIVQKNGDLYKVGISLFAKATIGIGTFFVVNILTHNLILASGFLVIVNVLGLMLYDRRNLKLLDMKKTKFSWKANNIIMKEGFFTFVLTFLGIYLINAPRYAIDDMLSNELQTIFGIIIMPATFMGLLGQYLIQPALTKLADARKEKNYKKLKNIIIKLLGIITVLGILVWIVAYFLEAPVLGIVYGIDLKPYTVSMMLIIFGATFYAISAILSNILISMRVTLEQAITYLILAVIATTMSYYLVGKLEVIGASLTYTIIMILNTISFSAITYWKLANYKKEIETENK